MKQLKITSILLLAIIPLFFSACSEEPTTTTPSASNNKTALISSSPWKMTQFRVSNDNSVTWTDYTILFKACALDDTWSFGTNGTVTLDEGATKCDPADPQTDTFPWSFSDNETKINLDGDLMDIAELSGTTMKLTQVDADLDLFETTFSH